MRSEPDDERCPPDLADYEEADPSGEQLAEENRSRHERREEGGARNGRDATGETVDGSGNEALSHGDGTTIPRSG